jgi:hypothetical protein
MLLASIPQVARAGDEVALDMVEPLLNDPSPSVRHAAVLATFFLGDVGAGDVYFWPSSLIFGSPACGRIFFVC